MKSIVLFFSLLAFCLNSPLTAQHTSNLVFNDSLTVNISLPFKHSVKRFEVQRSNRPKNIGFKIKPRFIRNQPTIECYLFYGTREDLMLLFGQNDDFEVRFDNDLMIVEHKLFQERHETKYIAIYKEFELDSQTYNVNINVHGDSGRVVEYYDLIF